MRNIKFVSALSGLNITKFGYNYCNICKKRTPSIEYLIKTKEASELWELKIGEKIIICNICKNEKYLTCSKCKGKIFENGRIFPNYSKKTILCGRCGFELPMRMKMRMR